MSSALPTSASNGKSPNGKQSRIPTPWPIRSQRLRQRFLPPLAFVGLAGLVLWMWHCDIPAPHTIGEVEAIRSIMTAGANGLLTEPVEGQRWQVLDKIDANQVLARLDDPLLSQQLVTQQAELERIKLEVEAATAKLSFDFSNQQRDHLHEQIRLAWKREQRRVTALQTQVQLAVDRILEQRLDAAADRAEKLFQQSTPQLRAATELESLQARLACNEVSARIAANEKTLAEQQRQIAQAEAGYDDYPSLRLPEVAPLLAPLQAAITTQTSRLDEVRRQIDGLVIRAPFAGEVAAIHAWPGQRVKLGDPIVTIASHERRYIVTYVRADQSLNPAPTDRVRVRRRHSLLHSEEATIEQVGSQFEPIPPQHLRDSRLPEWGILVRVALPNQLAVRAGELVELTFQSR